MGSPWIAHFLLRPQQELSILATRITALGRECYYSKVTTKYFQHSGWSIMILIEGQFDCRRITISSNCLFSTNSYGDVSLLDSPYNWKKKVSKVDDLPPAKRRLGKSTQVFIKHDSLWKSWPNFFKFHSVHVHPCHPGQLDKFSTPKGLFLLAKESES